MTTAETARSRRRLVEEAGWSTTSFISVIAGTLVAFGAVALLAAAAGAAGSALGLDMNGVSTDEWRRAGIAGGAIGALVVFLSFWFGGYTAGRMSRRAGGRHGLLVFACSVLLMAAIGLVGWAVADNQNVDVESDLAAEGVPTDANTWGDIGIGVGVAAGLAMLLGSVLGGISGDRWHGRLATAVVERREQLADEEAEHTRRQDAMVGDTPVDRTSSIDLRDAGLDDDHVLDHDRTRDLSIEEERERSRADHAL